MQFSFRSVPHHVTQKPQWQHRCYEGDVKTMYVPHWESPFAVTREGRYEGNVVGPISAVGAVPRILTVMVTGEVKAQIPAAVAVPEAVTQPSLDIKPAVRPQGRFKKGFHPKTGAVQWRREILGDDGNVSFVHIVHEQSNQPQNDTTEWDYRLVCRLTGADVVPEVWTVKLMQEVVSERALRRRKDAAARAAKKQELLAAEVAAQAERQKFRKELEVIRAGGGKKKQGKKNKQLAHAS